MNRLTNNDKTWGPLTVARWKDVIRARYSSGDNEDPENTLLFVAFGWALQIRMPNLIKPFGKYLESPREYGFSFSRMENGWEFFHLQLGPQTGDSETTRDWCAHLPWTQWRRVRSSLYTPTGDLFHEHLDGARYEEWSRKKDECPKANFGFEDFDGELIVATCTVEEREWHKGEGWFRWLRWFNKPKIHRSLDLWFSAEVGPEKGSYKGGTIGHGIDMLPGESPEGAFRRYCRNGLNPHGRRSGLRFIGPCKPPVPPEAHTCNTMNIAKDTCPKWNSDVAE